MMLSRRTLLKLVAAGAVPAFALCGCAHPQMIDLGSTESQVVEKLGKPDSITAMPDGTTCSLKGRKSGGCSLIRTGAL